MEVAPRKNTAYADYTANTVFSKSFTVYTAAQLLRKKAIMPMTYMIWLYSFKGSGAKRGVTGSD